MRSRITSRILLLALLLMWSSQSFSAEETVQLKTQTVRTLSGVVVYSNDEPVAGALVIEMTEGWMTELRHTETDANGRFSLPPVKGRKVYYLRIKPRGPGVNPLEVPVRLSRFRGKKELHLQVELA